MKILALNCNFDPSYFTSKGLNIEVEHQTVSLPIFPLKFLYNRNDGTGNMVDFYTPDVSAYLEANYKTFQYSVIMVGWNPADYSQVLNHTGGYTCPDKLSSGTRWITVRQDNLPVAMYPIHEMCHAICGIINIDFAYHFPIDFMDMTPIGNPPVWHSYYENDPNITDVNSNFNQTMRNITPFISKLNSITYMPTVTITRTKSDTKETIGELRTDDGGFGCYTLERAWVNNQKNISCIPIGTYTVQLKFMLSQLSFHYQVMNVPNRSGVFIHAGNFWWNSSGCILLGGVLEDINKDNEFDVLNSKQILSSLETKMKKLPFTLVVK